MLVRGKYILTSAYPEEIREGAFRITDGIISEIGKWDELNSKFPEDTVLGGKNELPNTTQLLGFIIISASVLSIALEKSSAKDVNRKSYYQGIILMICAILISSFGIVLMKPILHGLGDMGDLEISLPLLLLLCL